MRVVRRRNGARTATAGRLGPGRQPTRQRGTRRRDARAAHQPGDGIVWQHSFGPDTIMPPSYWPKVIRRFWEVLRTDQEALERWGRFFPGPDGTIAYPESNSPGQVGIVMELVRLHDPRQLPRAQSRWPPLWPCGSRCSSLRVGRVQVGRPVRLLRICGQDCCRGWSPSLGPHSRCRCHPCETNERRAIVARITAWQLHRLDRADTRRTMETLVPGPRR